MNETADASFGAGAGLRFLYDLVTSHSNSLFVVNILNV